MTRQTLRYARLSLSTTVLLLLSPGAFAEVTVERTTTISPMYDPSTVTTVREVRETTTPDVVESRRLLIAPSEPIASRSSVTTVVEGPFLGIENFAKRLHLMKDQLDLGTSRGWIGPFDAASFNNRYDNLLAQIDLARAQGLTYELGNSLEKQLNQFNIDLSDKMSTASAGFIQ